MAASGTMLGKCRLSSSALQDIYCCDLRPTRGMLWQSLAGIPMTSRCRPVQVWANCRAYNPEGTIVRQMGDRLSDTWEKKWYQQGVEAKWEGLMRELKEEDVRAPPA